MQGAREPLTEQSYNEERGYVSPPAMSYGDGDQPGHPRPVDTTPERSSTPVAGDVYRDKQKDATFTVQSYDPKRAYVYGVRSDFGPWSVFRPNFERFYERVS